MALDEKANYYDAGGIEVISVIRAKLTPEQLKGYFLGNVIKYSGRLNFKNPDDGLRDAEKTSIYSELLKVHIEDMEADKNYKKENFHENKQIFAADRIAIFESQLFEAVKRDQLTVETVMQIYYSTFIHI